jgi:hypothetical protein
MSCNVFFVFITQVHEKNHLNALQFMHSGLCARNMKNILQTACTEYHSAVMISTFTSSHIVTNVKLDEDEKQLINNMNVFRNLFYSSEKLQVTNEIACPTGTFAEINTRPTASRQCTACANDEFAGQRNCQPCDATITSQQSICSILTNYRMVQQKCSFFENVRCLACDQRTGCPFNTLNDAKQMCGNRVVDFYSAEECDIENEECHSENCTFRVLKNP